MSRHRCLRSKAHEQAGRVATGDGEGENVTHEPEITRGAAGRLPFDAPVSRLPSEILALIFTAHVKENNESPWILMQISRSWRAVALMTRSIWGRIMLVPTIWIDSKANGSHSRTYEGMEVCWNHSQLSRALKRAGGTPLDLKITLAPRNRNSLRESSTPPQASSVLRLIDSVAEHQGGPRLRSLSIVTHGEQNFVPSNKFQGFNFTAIVSLVVEDDVPGLVEQVVREARRLRCLSVPAQSLANVGKGGQWHEIEELSLGAIHTLQELGRIRSILLAATGLTVFKLSDEGLLHDSSDERIHIPSLRRFDLNGFNGRFPIESPHLTHLSLLALSFPDDGPEPGNVHLPNLVELEYTTIFQPHNLLRFLEVPSLRTFRFTTLLQRSGNARLFKDLWPSSTLANTGRYSPVSNIEPRVFHFRGIEINPKVLVRALAGRNLLEDISTIGVDINTEFMEGLLPLQTKQRTQKSQITQMATQSNWQLGCVALRRLCIDLVGCRIRQGQAALETSASALIAARTTAGAPFERFVMRFSKQEGWKELVDADASA